MKVQARYALIGTLVFATVATSCTTRVIHRNPSGTAVRSAQTGPPPHAPAHGYRHKHHGVDLVFEASLAMYVVSGHRDHYYLDGTYYRLRNSEWQVSTGLDGPWKSKSKKKVPPGLQKKYKHKGKK